MTPSLFDVSTLGNNHFSVAVLFYFLSLSNKLSKLLPSKGEKFVVGRMCL